MNRKPPYGRDRVSPRVSLVSRVSRLASGAAGTLLALLGVALASAALTGGCSGTEAGADGGGGKKVCTPGTYVFCRCADTKEGTKLCKDDGETFEACALGENLPCGEVPDPQTGDAAVPQPADAAPTPQTPAAEKCDGQNVALNASSEVTITGDTSAAADDYKGASACAGAKGAPDHVYALTVPTTGKLVVTLTPDAKFAPIAYLRSACADEATQLSCAQGLNSGQNAVLNANVIKGSTVYLVVDGAAGPNQAGPYSVKLKLTPGSFCGDGTVDDGEACDDINKVEGDGCGNDCRNVAGNPDSGKACPGQPVHVWTTAAVTGAGTTTGFPSAWNEPGSACTTGAGTNASPDHIYAVTAHRTGSMTVKTTGATYNVVLSARTDCNNPATMTNKMCANDRGTTAPLDETMTFPVTSGTTYYVGVSGAVGASGNYTVSFQIP
ncbi:MAG TPA: hypothetical protein PLR99_23045 [Polyangiaceae bacterium]|nr:hypothetical protein [Polyangiaceae bacterium]